MELFIFRKMIGNQIVRLGEVDSTNRYLMDWLARERPGEGSLVLADYQTAGRGMDENRWESQHGRNLTFSFVLYPHFLAVDAQFYLNKAISLALFDAVKELLDLPGVSIKWPNDIYIENRKVAGILIQNGVKSQQFDFSVIGVGLNVNQEGFGGEVSNPVSLKMVTGREYDLESVLKNLIMRFEFRLAQLKEGLKQQLDNEYLGALYRYRELAQYQYKGETITARISGVTRYGQLLLEIPGEKIIECDLKEIRFIIPPISRGSHAI